MAGYLLDTNVLLRLSSSASKDREQMSNAVETLLSKGHSVVTVPQNYYEFWSVATRPAEVNGFAWSVEHTRAEIDFLSKRFTRLGDTADVFANWLELVTKHEVKGKQVHDARLVAAMQAHGLTHLLTLNIKDFERYSEITAVHPKELSHAGT